MRFWPRSKKPVVPVVRLHGVIGQGTSLRPGLSLAGVESALDKAFAMRGPAVALVINSPGGSPVQSSLIVQRIRALAEKHEKPTIAFVEDVAASGGYWLACAADEIIADASSIVGSIGVVTATFGFPELLSRIGVERRVYTIGENKAILDPFKPQRDADVAILHAVQSDVHEAFVAAIKDRRGDRLGDDPDLFTGRFWSGHAAVGLGLVDGLGEIRTTLKSRFGEKIRIKSVSTSRPSLLRRLGLASAPSADSLVGAAYQHMLWDRYGA
ncbi:S49 family peptidase [Acuticoccus sediminis]|uniref:S49 family peptidase n=1 Tax=Acuticoccus sediminis TaxID=2184697 RepID=A0A8B2NVF9_9HYPH|nr:S49 family peptidase [Acuticoccus sediminis]RAI01153.1 S49 family peptidase [Acuticoccus sediminis]